MADAAALRGLRRPRVPHKVIEPVADDVLRRLLAVGSVRDRAIVLLMLDTGLRVSEVAGLRLGDLRPDGTVKVRGKGLEGLNEAAKALRVSVEQLVRAAAERLAFEPLLPGPAEIASAVSADPRPLAYVSSSRGRVW